jgi:hypothetical protein
MNKRLLAITLLVTGLGSAVALTAQSPALPAFAVAAPGGQAVPSSALSGEAQWVLAYVRPGAVATTRLLEALGAWQLAPEHLRRLVFIVEGPADTAAKYLAGTWKPENGALTWFSDADGQAAQALGLTGATALKGVRGGAVEWSLEGVLNDPAAYEPTLKMWIGATLR